MSQDISSQLTGDTKADPEPRMAFCPACFIEVTPEQADRQTLDSRRMKWLEQFYAGSARWLSSWRDFMTLVAEVGFRDAIDRTQKSQATANQSGEDQAAFVSPRKSEDE